MGFLGSIYRFCCEQRWTIGFIELPIEEVLEGRAYEVHYLKGMLKDRWFADPFILDYDDNVIHLLVEEFSYNVRRGRIALLTVDRIDYSLLDFSIILDIPTHLSFPFILRKNGKLFVCPENSESKSWTIYEYDINTNNIVKIKTIEGVTYTDAIVTNHFGDDIIFTTHLPIQNGNVLFIYTREGSLINEVSFNSNIARNAGDWFLVDGKVYRPAQDCNGGYGLAVVIQEVRQNKEKKFEFRDILRIVSSNSKYNTGCHTFNTYKGISVVDVHGYRRVLLAKVMNFIIKNVLRRKI